MINYEQKMMGIGNQESPIEKFEVWFRIPIGLTQSLDTAIQRCKELDFDPELCIVPVVVAISGNLYEELRR